MSISLSDFFRGRRERAAQAQAQQQADEGAKRRRLVELLKPELSPPEAKELDGLLNALAVPDSVEADLERLKELDRVAGQLDERRKTYRVTHAELQAYDRETDSIPRQRAIARKPLQERETAEAKQMQESLKAVGEADAIRQRLAHLLGPAPETPPAAESPSELSKKLSDISIDPAILEQHRARAGAVQ